MGAFFGQHFVADCMFDEMMDHHDKTAKNKGLQAGTVLPVFAMRFKMRVVLCIQMKGKAKWKPQVHDGKDKADGDTQMTEHNFKKRVDWRETIIGLVSTSKEHCDLFDHEAWHKTKAFEMW
jgi:hypothetical protein